MDVNWRAVGYGFLATVILGVLSGAAIPYTDFTMPTVSYGLTGLIGGAIAGYMTIGAAGDGALNGILATIIGGLVVLGVLSVIGTLVAGLLGLDVALLALFFWLSLGFQARSVAISERGTVDAALPGRRDARRHAESNFISLAEMT